MKIIFATQNEGKVKEMKELLSEFAVLSAREAGIYDDVIEDGTTFAENALKKARFIARKTGEWAVADDSGLCIAALDNAPGVFSARWAGEKASEKDIIEFTLDKMKNAPPGKRQAYFESAVALVSPCGEEKIFSGRINGSISTEPAGAPRLKLPYDLIFIPEGDSRTFAQMSDLEKNGMSHRGLAFKELKKYLSLLLLQ